MKDGLVQSNASDRPNPHSQALKGAIMNNEIPPLIDEKGRIRYVKPDGGVQSNLDDLNDLAFAASHGRTDIVKSLLEKGADVNAGSDMYSPTALGAAIANGHAGVVRVLAENGADVNGRDKSGQTYLIFAVVLGQAEVVKVLLQVGADVNTGDNFGVTPLMWAVANERTDLVRLLLEAGADTKAVDNSGKTALSYVPNRSLFNVPFLGEFYSSKGNNELLQLLKGQNL
jgi:ankyrin repeat protein